MASSLPPEQRDPPGRERRSVPYGSWPSPLAAGRVAAGGLSLAETRIDRGAVYWLEGRPAEGGRVALLRAVRDADPLECTPREVSVRTRVHEYGGGAYAVRDGRLFFVDDRAGRVREAGGGALGDPAARYADLALSPDGRWLVAVEERAEPGAGPGSEPCNALVALATDGSGRRVVLDAAHDFVSSPAFSPDGRALAWIAWRHPHMPWDETALYVAGWSGDGPRGNARRVAGEQGESIFQPRFGPDGRLLFVSDRSGWWNLHALEGEAVRALYPMQAEFGAAQWVLGLSRWAFIDAHRLLCVAARAGESRLCELDLAAAELRPLPLDLCSFEGLEVEDGLACFVGAGRAQAPAVHAFELGARRLHRLRSSAAEGLAPERICVPAALELESPAGEPVQAFFYAPHSPEVVGPPGERPPLRVHCHGGPTAVATPELDLRVQYWTSRGFAVLDVNYAGSTTFGRARRERLAGRWGIADVDDCVAAAQAVLARGLADPERTMIGGGSAGGYTALCALCFRDGFRAGASRYGIGDLEALARDTHKFEAHYLDKLVGPYPECAQRYRERSPIHHAQRLSCPVIFFQGSEDRVVPPQQAEAMVAALAARGVPHAYVLFEGEGHGFRRAESIARMLDGELSFLAQVFGFEAQVEPGAQITLQR